MSASSAPDVTAREPGSRAVHTVDFTKRYGRDGYAVNGINLDVPHGAVYGFLGPNGSGKTTTIRMLLGLIEITNGECEVLGRTMPEALDDVLPRVGAMVDGPAFHPSLSGRDNLRRLDAADRTSNRRTCDARAAEALDRVGLSKAARKPFGSYSLGMKQRLAIAAALLRPRELLILDEPTNGLDPQGTREVRGLIRALGDDGMTILLSTHLLSEVEQICSHVGVMLRGDLIAQGTLDGLRGAIPTRIRVESSDLDAVAGTLARLKLDDVRAADGAVSALLGESEPEKILAALVAESLPIRGFTVVEPRLEDVFISLTGEGFDVSG